MGMFGKIEEAKVTKTGQYFGPGKYQVKLLVVKEVESTKNSNKEYVAIETKVLASDNPAHPAGAERSQVIDMTNVMGLPNFKGFLAAVSGVDPSMESLNSDVCNYWKSKVESEITLEQVCELVVSPANPLEGLVMDLECVTIKTQAGGDFTKHIWAPRDVSKE